MDTLRYSQPIAQVTSEDRAGKTSLSGITAVGERCTPYSVILDGQTGA